MLPFQDRARQLGISDKDSSYLLAVVGISNTVSRIVLGYISDQPWVNRLYLYNIALTLCGIGEWSHISIRAKVFLFFFSFF